MAKQPTAEQLAQQHLAHAGEILGALREDPTLTVQLLADKLDLDEATVIEILDEHRVNSTGGIEHAGPGRGGGWVPADSPK